MTMADTERRPGSVEGGSSSEGMRRRFQDDTGAVWVAEVKRPRSMRPSDEKSTPMILFWNDNRACLASLRSERGFMELSVEELRQHLRACLSR